MSRSARLVVRVVLVPAGASAAEARRRVADVLLRAATPRDTTADATAPPIPASEPPALPSEKAA